MLAMQNFSEAIVAAQGKLDEVVLTLGEEHPIIKRFHLFIREAIDIFKEKGSPIFSGLTGALRRLHDRLI